MSRPANLATLALLGALGTACTSWQPTTVAPANLEGRDVTVYIDSVAIRLRNVRATDTLFIGQAWESRSDTAVRVADIDSARVRRPDLVKTLIAVIGVPLSAITFIMLIDSPDSL